MSEKVINKNQIDMTNGNLFMKMVRFAVPLMISGILQLLYSASDLIVVGQFGSEHSVAAIGNTNALINLIVNLFMGLSVGGNVSLAKAIGENDNEKANKIVHTSIFLSLIGGVVLGIIGFIFAETFLTWMGTPKDVIKLSTIYIKVYFLGMPFNLLYNFGAALLRAKGDTRRPMFYLTFAGIINVLLNLFLVICFNLDVMGVAIATITAQAISSILVLICLMRENDYTKFSFKKMKIYKDEMLEIIRIGLPSGLQGSVFSISNVLIQSSVNSFGSVVMAGNSASQNIEGFTFTAMNSIYQATISFTSQNHGAKKKENFMKIFFYGLILVISLGLLFGGITYLLGNQLISLYTDSSEAIQIGVKRLLFMVVPYFICGMQEISCAMVRGLGHSILPMVVSIVGICGFRLIWIYTVFASNRTLDTLYIAYLLSWIITFIMHTISYLIVYKKTSYNIDKGI